MSGAGFGTVLAMPSAATLKVAIVGSGPAGCYLAERLARRRPAAIEVDVFERLPTPFGLVRGGVAPDHQGTKAVARVLARAFGLSEVRFFGNVEIGGHLPLAALRSAYDAVVLAVGAPRSRRLGIAGENVPGVVDSGSFVGWYNAHPDHPGCAVDLARVRTAVVIGNGNVAVDVVRVLCRAGDPAAMRGSDLDPDVEATIAAAPLKRIVVAGRRGPADVRFTPAELSELAGLTRARPTIDAGELAEVSGDAPTALTVLRGFAAATPTDTPITIAFRFRLSPEAFLAGRHGRLCAVRFRRTPNPAWPRSEDHEVVEIKAELAVTCVGYEAVPCGGLYPQGGVFGSGGHVGDGLYAVGWAGRGPSGTIATNRPEAHALADRLLAEVRAAGRPGRAAIIPMLADVPIVDWSGWQRIDAAETARAPAGRARRKFTRIDDMLAAAKESPLPANADPCATEEPRWMSSTSSP